MAQSSERAWEEQLDSLKWRHRFHPRQRDVDDCWDFQETAGILMNCDLVITSDSGLAHLAAGLGRPTWLLLMKVPEWRWGLEGSTTPWYPSMHLFRQEERHDWSRLINKQVIPALRHWLKQQHTFKKAETRNARALGLNPGSVPPKESQDYCRSCRQILAGPLH